MTSPPLIGSFCCCTNTHMDVCVRNSAVQDNRMNRHELSGRRLIYRCPRAHRMLCAGCRSIGGVVCVAVPGNQAGERVQKLDEGVCGRLSHPGQQDRAGQGRAE